MRRRIPRIPSMHSISELEKKL